MGKPEGLVQVNIFIPAEWRAELKNLARIYSVEEGRKVTFADLIRRGIQEKFQLDAILPTTDDDKDEAGDDDE